MAAVTLALGTPKIEELPSDAGHARAVVCPVGARYLLVRCQSGHVRWGGVEGADDAELAEYVTVSQGEAVAIRIPGSGAGDEHLMAPTTVYVASSEADDDVELLAAQERD